MGEVASEYQKTILPVMLQKANEAGYDVFVFCSYGSYGNNMLYTEGEKNGIYLPVYERLDGIIVGCDTFDVEGMDKELEKVLLERAKCPVVYVRTRSDLFYSVMIQNQESMEDVVRHFIKEHGFRDICFMTGKMANRGAQERLAAFQKVMREEGIPVTEHMVFYGDYWREKGREAVEWYMEGRETYPQAIICSNDYMAMSICEELKRRNVRVPEDVCVSGYDDIWEAETYQPALTSVGVPFTQLAEKTIELIDALCRGEERDRISWVKSEMKFRKSCGCGEQEKQADRTQLMQKVYRQDDDIKQVVFMTTDFQDAYEEQEYLYVAEKYFLNTFCQKGYLCLCEKGNEQEDEEEDGRLFSDRMCLKRVFSSGKKGIECEEYFDRGDLLPGHVLEGRAQSFLIMPLHFENKYYGYMALQPEEGGWISSYVQAYMMCFANAIEASVMHQEIAGLREIRKLYQKDALTGIYNRRGFERHLRVLYEQLDYEKQYLTVVSIDMDGLKYINDHYGHAEGDESLQRIAKVLEGLTGENEVCARMGGDEFAMLLFSGTSERHRNFEKEFQQAMELENTRIQKPYPLLASIGLCCVNEEPDTSLIACIRIADKRMYTQKKNAKRRREDMNL